MAKKQVAENTLTPIHIPKKFYFFTFLSNKGDYKEYWRRFKVIYPLPYIYFINRKIFQ